VTVGWSLLLRGKLFHMEPKSVIQIQNSERKGKKERKMAVGKGEK